LYAPVALFLYNRFEHAQKTVEALLQAHNSENAPVYIFCDGIPDNASSNTINSVAAVRHFAKSITGFKSINIIEHPKNIGLRASILFGIDYVLQSYTSIIIIEDDIVVGKDFLKFMNASLIKYQEEPTIAGISGYSFPIKETKPYFTRTGSCWGWATYKRVWEPFIKARTMLNIDLIEKEELKLFNVFDHLYSNMFLQSKEGLIQSWAVEFYLYYFSQKQFFLMPGVNLIANVGFDGSGAHQKKGNFLTDNNPIQNLPQIIFPAAIKEELYIRKKIENLYQRGYAKPNIMQTLINKIKLYI
jgi:hypothetical protein